MGKRKPKPGTSWSGIAQTVVKVPGTIFEYEAFSLTIEDGVVVKKETLTRAPNLPAIAVNHAGRALTQNKEQMGEEGSR